MNVDQAQPASVRKRDATCLQAVQWPMSFAVNSALIVSHARYRHSSESMAAGCRFSLFPRELVVVNDDAEDSLGRDDAMPSSASAAIVSDHT